MAEILDLFSFFSPYFKLKSTRACTTQLESEKIATGSSLGVCTSAMMLATVLAA